MKKYYHKLHNLHSGQMFFPPEILLHMRSECSQHIVSVHEDVDETVDETKEGWMTASKKFHTDPGGDWH